MFFMICCSTSAITLAGLNWRYSVTAGALQPGRDEKGVAGLDDLLTAARGEFLSSRSLRAGSDLFAGEGRDAPQEPCANGSSSRSAAVRFPRQYT
jgi:hypothetical protein